MAIKSYVETVSAQPVKRFFVEMLTRDITLEDALLDLLDNCVDGIQRSVDAATLAKVKPYEGFEAKISFKKGTFSIEDNCGGIPWDLRGKAFRIGRAKDTTPSKIAANALMVGAYGIGMKRAIFKIGRQALIRTRTTKDEYEVSLPKGWMDDENNWNLTTSATSKKLAFHGTHLEVSDLVPDVALTFAEEAFQKSLYEKVATHFAIIISKGLKVTLSTFGVDIIVIPKYVTLHFQETATDKATGEIRPYAFHSKPDKDLEVTVFIGLRDSIPDAESVLAGQLESRYSTDYAGVTVICNDRVVLYCNRDELTGWGTAKVPSYHTQFIAISGYIEFKGDPAKLPTTTTKRGLEYSSRIYQQVLDRVRDGLRIFVDYTNWWKSNETHAKRHISKTPALSFAQLKNKFTDSTSIKLSPVRTGMIGDQYRPALPRPKEEMTEVRVAFTRSREDVFNLAEHRLKQFDQLAEAVIPRLLGEELFDSAFKKLR